MERLAALPSKIGEREADLAEAERDVEDGERFIKELKESVEIAEGNAALNVNDDAFPNEPARNRARKAAIANDPQAVALRASLGSQQSQQVSLDFIRRQARGKLSALKAEMDSLKVIADLMVGKMALESAKLENATALLQLQAAQAQGEILQELKKKE
jgi:uncharacterized membrane protein YciS (DUF1049 family)